MLNSDYLLNRDYFKVTDIAMNTNADTLYGLGNLFTVKAKNSDSIAVFSAVEKKGTLFTAINKKFLIHRLLITK